MYLLLVQSDYLFNVGGMGAIFKSKMLARLIL